MVKTRVVKSKIENLSFQKSYKTIKREFSYSAFYVLVLFSGFKAKNIQSRTLNWTNALTSYYTKSRRFSVDLVGFGPVRVSHVEKPELDQICCTHGD